MPDKRSFSDGAQPHKEALEPPYKRIATNTTSNATKSNNGSSDKNHDSDTMTEEGIIATLTHPRAEPGFSGSPFTATPAFQQPAPLCSFSFDQHRRLWHDDRSKRFYRGPPPYNNPHPHPHQSRAPPVFGADLNFGLDRYVQRDESVPEHLDALIAALQHRTESAPTESERIQRDSERRRADFVTWRGIITKICTAYEQTIHTQFADPLDLNVMLLDNTLYLEEYVSPSKSQEKAHKERDPKMRRFGYYGYSFESYCTVEREEQIRQPFSPHHSHNDDHNRADAGSSRAWPVGWSGDVNTNVQWCQVVKTKLGPHRLVIGGEVDAVEPLPHHHHHHHSSTTRESLVELKTSMQMTPYHRNATKAAVDQDKFEKKLYKFYLQSFLLGIPKIVVGFRDHHGLLTTHQEFETLRIPRMVRAGYPIAGQVDREGGPLIRKQTVWDPKDSLGFADQILTFIKSTISKHHPPTTSSSGTTSDAASGVGVQVYRVTFHPPFTRIDIRPLTPNEINQQARDNAATSAAADRVGFLPRSFVHFVLSRSGPAPAPAASATAPA